MSRHSRLWTAIGVGCLLLVVAGLLTWWWASQPERVGATGTVSTVATEQDALNRLTMAPEGPQTGYSRARFGPAWSDVDHNGCSTRVDILARDLAYATTKTVGRCDHVVATGTLYDPYTGGTIAYTSAHPSAVEPDHIVSLSEAWRSGAAGWTPQERLDYANDPLVLQATGDTVNNAKSDHDAAHVWPQCVVRDHRACTLYVDDRPSGPRGCTYARDVIAIKTKYRLTVDSAEYAALQALLAEGCPS